LSISENVWAFTYFDAVDPAMAFPSVRQALPELRAGGQRLGVNTLALWEQNARRLADWFPNERLAAAS
jgi:hypothetical protein